MTVDGFFISACEGWMPQDGLWNDLPAPAQLRGVRPDACGIAPTTGEVAFGEAKTYRDIDTVHTRKQLRVFGRVSNADGGMCRLYVAVPRSVALTLDRVLGDVGLLGERHVVRMHIPDCLVTESPL